MFVLMQITSFRLFVDVNRTDLNYKMRETTDRINIFISTHMMLGDTLKHGWRYNFINQ